jgi:hypothetical protein
MWLPMLCPLLLGKGRDKLNHPAEVLLGVAPTVLGYQLSRQCGDNLFTVSGALAAQHLQVDALADTGT